MDKQQLVGFAILVKVRHLLSYGHLVPQYVVVTHQADSAVDSVAFWSHLGCLKMTMAQCLILQEFRSHIAQVFPSRHLGWQIDVVERGHRPAEPTGGN